MLRDKMNPKQRKHEENHTETQKLIKLLRPSDKDK